MSETQLQAINNAILALAVVAPSALRAIASAVAVLKGNGEEVTLERLRAMVGDSLAMDAEIQAD